MSKKIGDILFPGRNEYPKNGIVKNTTLGFQHAFAMCCATILVPLLTGLDVGVALFTAGLGTIIFHLCTRGKMPTFLGSSFAYLPALFAIVGNEAFGATKEEQIGAAMGGIISAGAVYVVISLVIAIFGKKLINKLFPPVVRGVGIAIIGLNLIPTAINNIQSQTDAAGNALELFGEGYDMSIYVWSWIIAGVVCLLAVILSSYCKGPLKLSSIFIALVVGYVGTYILVQTGVAPASMLSLGGISERLWFEVPKFVLPRFNITAIGIVAPIAIVTCVEHVGDVYANGAVVGKDFSKDPGLHRTMLGDGLATLTAGFLGGPANTTYSENTAVLAATGNYNPASLRIAAVISMITAFLGKAIGALETIPNCVLGGVCIVLYGMIASVGLRTLVEEKVDFKDNRNLCIAAIMLCLAMGGAVIGTAVFNFSGIGLGIIVGIVLNLILPAKKAKAAEAVETAPEAVETAPEAVETAPEAVETAPEATEANEAE